jgi:hypothetical protein
MGVRDTGRGVMDPRPLSESANGHARDVKCAVDRYTGVPAGRTGQGTFRVGCVDCACWNLDRDAA